MSQSMAILVLILTPTIIEHWWYMVHGRNSIIILASCIKHTALSARPQDVAV